jgi:acyl-coenzyme A thioesterase PaaI-like protein
MTDADLRGNRSQPLLGSLADFAGVAAAGTLLPPGWANMTIDYAIKILAPGKGDEIIARGRVVKPGQLMTVATADLYSVSGAEEILCAVAFITMRNIRLPSA